MSELMSLSERLAAIRQVSNTSPLSEVTRDFPLEQFIRLYNKCGRECYINYMAGAKKLITYLAPIEIDSNIIFSNNLMHTAIIHGYEVQALAFLIAESVYPQLAKTVDILKHVKYIENCIIYYTAKHILEGVTV